jgi:hypothetical protein
VRSPRAGKVSTLACVASVPAPTEPLDPRTQSGAQAARFTENLRRGIEGLSVAGEVPWRNSPKAEQRPRCPESRLCLRRAGRGPPALRLCPDLRRRACGYPDVAESPVRRAAESLIVFASKPIRSNLVLRTAKLLQRQWGLAMTFLRAGGTSRAPWRYRVWHERAGPAVVLPVPRAARAAAVTGHEIENAVARL